MPRVVRTLEGHTHDTIALADGVRTRVRMLTHLDGIQIRETARTAAQRRAMGTRLAELNRALHGFAHPGAAHDLLWNVSAAHRLARQARCDRRRTTPRACRQVHGALHRRRAAPPRVAAVAGDPQRLPPLPTCWSHPTIMRASWASSTSATCCMRRWSAKSRPPPPSTWPDAQILSRGRPQFVAAYHAALPLTDAEQEIVCRSHGHAPSRHGADLRMARRALPREPRVHHASQPRRVGGPVPHGGPFPRHGTRPAAGGVRTGACE